MAQVRNNIRVIRTAAAISIPEIYRLQFLALDPQFQQPERIHPHRHQHQLQQQDPTASPFMTSLRSNLRCHSHRTAPTADDKHQRQLDQEILDIPACLLLVVILDTRPREVRTEAFLLQEGRWVPDTVEKMPVLPHLLMRRAQRQARQEGPTAVLLGVSNIRRRRLIWPVDRQAVPQRRYDLHVHLVLVVGVLVIIFTKHPIDVVLSRKKGRFLSRFCTQPTFYFQIHPSNSAINSSVPMAPPAIGSKSPSAAETKTSKVVITKKCCS